jgi:hypothetical protein
MSPALPDDSVCPPVPGGELSISAAVRDNNEANNREG